MTGVNCCCSLSPSACKTCQSLRPELYENAVDPQRAINLHVGWICPVCGYGVAPNVQICSCQLKVS